MTLTQRVPRRCLPRGRVATVRVAVVFGAVAVGAVFVAVGSVTLALGVVRAGDAASAASPALPAWSTPSRIEPGGTGAGYDSVYGVSCPTTRTCIAVDETGKALTWRGGRWSAPQTVDDGNTLNSVSCPSTTFCVATASGQASVFDGRSWGAARTVGAPATYRVSCPTTTFCGAVGATGYPGQPSIVATFDGTAWASSATQSTGTLEDRLLDLSCPQAGRCTAVNHDGQVLRLAGGRWAPQRQRIEPGASAVSCPTVAFCMAVGSSYVGVFHVSSRLIPAWYATETGGHWSAARPVPGMKASIFLSVSCPTTGQCMVVGLSGKATQWRNGSWATPQMAFPGRVSATVDVSCPAVNRCMAVNSQGFASVFG